MEPFFIFDKARIRAELTQFIDYTRTLTEQSEQAEAIQAWETVLFVASTPTVEVQANLSIGQIYRQWDELFTAQRFLGKAHQIDSDNLAARSALNTLNRYIAENQEEVFEERDRKNSDKIVSLFRIATGLKLLQMDKAVQAYPLMKSRTKIYPNAAVAKHLLTDIVITAEEKNAAIAFLEADDWLVNTQHERYAITDSGLYAFYTALAKLHVANEAYGEAADCYEQAYWLNDSDINPLYRKVICDAKSEAWKAGLALLDWLPDEPPDGLDAVEYHSAVATICGLAYQSTGDKATGERAIAACETVLALDKKNKAISNRLKSLRSEEALRSDTKPKRKWWPW